MSKRIEFYVGIDKKDEPRLMDFVYSLNEDSDEKFHTHVWENQDDPYGYYTYRLSGTWESYKCFQGQGFVKSLEHFEE